MCRFADGRFTCYKAADGLSSKFATSVLLESGRQHVGGHRRSRPEPLDAPGGHYTPAAMLTAAFTVRPACASILRFC